MRISASVFMALPLLAFAAEEAVPEGAAGAAEGVAEGATEGLAGEGAETGIFDQYKAQFQNFLGSFGGKPAAESEKVQEMRKEQAAVQEIPVEGSALSTLTLDNWHETLFGSLPEDTTTPEEWWLFVTGRNKTCNGYCYKAEAAFNETAARFSALTETETPNMATINCDDERVLCAAWGAGPGSLWILDVLPPPSDIEIYSKRLNLSRVTVDDVEKYLDPAERGEFKPLATIFHPFNSKIAKLGLSVPVGYVIHYVGLVPSWMFMFGLSILSRTMMSNRMQNHEARRAAQPAAQPAAN